LFRIFILNPYNINVSIAKLELIYSSASRMTFMASTFMVRRAGMSVVNNVMTSDINATSNRSKSSILTGRVWKGIPDMGMCMNCHFI